uniref:C2 domain-containing protein n=1 Tax=Leersia perrieri TaxID=77586 RepID=A0A0D9WFS2_9ORYZ
MASRTLELTLLSASDLRGVNLVSRMEVYAVVYLAGDPRSRHRLPTDRSGGGRNPSWSNATVRLAVPASGAGCGALRVLLRTERAAGSDRDVGEVVVPLPGLLACAGDGPMAAAETASYPVRKVGSSRTTHGVLNLSYKLGAVVHPDAAACGCKPAAPAYLAAAAAAYKAAPPPVYGCRRLPPVVGTGVCGGR